MDAATSAPNLSDWITVFATAVSAIAAIIAAIMARNAVDESKRLRKATTYPDIAIFLETNPRAENVIDLVVRNIGAGAASDVRFQIPKNPIPFQTNFVIADSALGRGLPYMPPGKELRYMLGTGASVSNDSFTVGVSCAVAGSSTDTERLIATYLLSTNEFDGMGQFDNTERLAQKSLKAAMDALMKGKVRITVQEASSGRTPL